MHITLSVTFSKEHYIQRSSGAIEQLSVEGNVTNKEEAQKVTQYSSALGTSLKLSVSWILILFVCYNIDMLNYIVS